MTDEYCHRGIDVTIPAQEVFDKAVRGVIEQGGPSVGPYVDNYGKEQLGCMYRSGDGRKCAAGHLLEDGEVKEGVHFTALRVDRLEEPLDPRPSAPESARHRLERHP